jgi:serine/threonine protein kinase
MASKKAQMQYTDLPELKEFVLSNVHKTGTSLGRGAFGTVEELAVGRTLCAGKKLHAVLLDAHNEGVQRTIKRFITECKLMSKLRHPRIVQFMGLCFFDDSPYPMLVMEKLDVDLQTLLETRNNVPFVAVLHILQDIAEGLVHMHGQSPPVIHRDLTARNVLIIQGSLRAKIGDLGNALCMSDLATVTNSLSRIPGTLLYMPPEAFEYAKKYDSMLDMFSFGHLALFAMIQEFPRELLAPNFYDEKGELKARNEVGRRGKYIEKLVAKLTKNHVVTKMIIQCLHNVPEKR